MRAFDVAFLAIIALSAACEGPSPSVSGKWVDETYIPYYAPYYWDVLYLNDDGGAVSGKYVYGSPLMAPLEDSSSIVGSRSGTSVHLEFRTYGDQPVTFAGELERAFGPAGWTYLVGWIGQLPDTVRMAWVRAR